MSRSDYKQVERIVFHPIAVAVAIKVVLWAYGCIHGTEVDGRYRLALPVSIVSLTLIAIAAGQHQCADYCRRKAKKLDCLVHCL